MRCAAGSAISALRSAAVVPFALMLACGGGPTSPSAPAVPVVPATPKAAADDVEVAKVNGRSVWSSCVAAQAAGIAADKSTPARSAEALRAAALDQCISFELLAQAAEARGEAAQPDVTDGLRTAEVSRLIELGFEDVYKTAAEMPEPVNLYMQRNGWRMHLIQLRASSYARFVVAKDAPAEQDAKARALAEKLAAELAPQTGLFPIDLSDAAARINTGSGITLQHADVKPLFKDDLYEPYASALYNLPAVGRTSPAIRMQWGWDVVLWTGGVEAKDTTRDQLIAEVLPELRRAQFSLWLAQIIRQAGLHIERHPELLDQYEREAEADPNVPDAPNAPNVPNARDARGGR